MSGPGCTSRTRMGVASARLYQPVAGEEDAVVPAPELVLREVVRGHLSRGRRRGRPLGPRRPAARRTRPAMPPALTLRVPGEERRRRAAESRAGSGEIVPPAGGHRESARHGGTRPRRDARGWHAEGVAPRPARVTPDADGGRAPR